ncbi:hypothetical protein P691DRAFT_538837 [Macrolepiota fuliginosa MF-IS2]|uniref:Uncharacterized protein n=1 Tax=Macrolepiota fuliginosa MF-IS2 TaxID=1400762 RepID=A0A9P5X1P2_9AGAR|nr:hypothetical protein P691DRAFT_538837 [Macrolepiota fuliginosa MF-IS2]
MREEVRKAFGKVDRVKLHDLVHLHTRAAMFTIAQLLIPIPYCCQRVYGVNNLGLNLMSEHHPAFGLDSLPIPMIPPGKTPSSHNKRPTCFDRRRSSRTKIIHLQLVLICKCEPHNCDGSTILPTDIQHPHSPPSADTTPSITNLQSPSNISHASTEYSESIILSEFLLAYAESTYMK